MTKKKVSKKKKVRRRRKRPSVLEKLEANTKPIYGVFNNVVQGLECQGETYVKLSELLLDYADMYARSQHYNQNFILKALLKVHDPTMVKFWNDSKLESLHKFVANNMQEYNSYQVGHCLIAMLKSNKDNDFKDSAVKKLKKMPYVLRDFILESDKVEHSLKTYVVDHFNLADDFYTDIILKGEDKKLMGTAIRQLKIEEINSLDVLTAIAGCASQNNHDFNKKRIEAIKRVTNSDVLNNIVFQDENFDVVKAARERLRELPNALKFIFEERAVA